MVGLFTLLTTVVVALSLSHAAGISFKQKYVDIANRMEIEISTPVSGSGEGRYVSVAFAEEPEMKDAGGYYCTDQTMKSFTIKEQHYPPVENTTAGEAHLVGRGVRNGQLWCKFLRPVTVTKTVSKNREVSFDLSKGVYVLLAEGKFSEGKMNYHDTKEILSDKLTVKVPSKSLNDKTCRMEKNCLKSPANCSLTDPKCFFFSIRPEGSRVVIEISGGVGDGQQYAAVGFSSQHGMVDADVYYCDGKTLTSAVIRENYTRPIVLDDKFVKVDFVTTINGVGQCVFSRDICVTKNVSSGTAEEFDFVKHPYNFLYAHGDISSGGEISYHGLDNRGLTRGRLRLIPNSTTVHYKCVEIPDPVAPETTTVEVVETTATSTSVSKTVEIRPTTSKAIPTSSYTSIAIILVVMGSVLFVEAMQS